MVQVCESKKFAVIRAPVKPALIRWARERASYSLHQLSGRFPRIEAWERGETRPTLRQLEAYAQVTHAPIGFFFLEAPPVEAMPIPDLRTATGVPLDRPSLNLLDTVYLCQQRQHWYRDFVQSVQEPQLEIVASAQINDDVLETAAKMRNALGIDSDEWVSIASWKGALRHLMAQADARGVLVMFSRVVGSDNRRRLDPQEFRGLALADPWAPVVFVNGADTTAAQMFTLAHELVHIWLGESGVSDTDARDVPDHASERWCSRVAAEFLVPLDALREELKPSPRRPDPFGQSQRALRDRALWNKDFGVSGTLNGEWRPASDRVNDFRCRPRARKCRIGLCGLPPRTLRGFRDRRRTETVAPGPDLLRAAQSG